MHTSKNFWYASFHTKGLHADATVEEFLHDVVPSLRRCHRAMSDEKVIPEEKKMKVNKYQANFTILSIWYNMYFKF